MSENELSTFERKLLERRRLAQGADTLAAPAFIPDDDIPEVDLDISPEQKAIDDAIAALDIVDAYRRWCGKSDPKSYSRQKEGIKVSCPNPAHLDKDPSAWLNTEKKVYFCGGCQAGGDIWDIAAYHFGFPVPGYKEQRMFRDLREKIALDLGFSFVKAVGKTHIVPPDNNADDSAETEVEKNVALLPSGAAHEAAAEEQASTPAPELAWRQFVPPNTFLHEWLLATTKDDCPEEYHIWTGLIALGFAVGRTVTLSDAPEVVSNLFVCLVGPSGAGKSKAKRHLRDILVEALPYDDNNVFSSGAKIIGRAGSGEYLVGSFSAPILDPSEPKKTLGYAPVRGYVDYEEFAGLVSTASRAGSTLKDQLMDIYDAQRVMAGGSYSNGKRQAEYPFGSVTSTTQNYSLRNLLKKADDQSGFINRWVFAGGKLKPVRSWGGVQVNLTRPAEFLKAVHLWGSTTKSITMTEPAMERWNDFFFGTLYPTKSMSENNGSAMLNRLDLLMKKLILLFTVNLKQDTVPAEAVEQAITMFPYLLQTYGVVGAEIVKTDEVEHGELILSQIKRLAAANGKGPTARDIYLSIKSKFSSYKECGQVLRNMEDIGLVSSQSYKPNGPGRPSVRWAVNE